MANIKRTLNILFRVSKEERNMKERRMAQNSIKSLKAYLLMAIGGRVIHVELESIKEMIHLLSNAMHNLNQIAQRVNETGNIYAEDIADLQARYEELWVQTKKILRKLSAL